MDLGERQLHHSNLHLTQSTNSQQDSLPSARSTHNCHSRSWISPYSLHSLARRHAETMAGGFGQADHRIGREEVAE